MSPKKDKADKLAAKKLGKKADKKLAKNAASSDNELTEAEINELQANVQVDDWGEGAPPRGGGWGVLSKVVPFSCERSHAGVECELEVGELDGEPGPPQRADHPVEVAQPLGPAAGPRIDQLAGPGVPGEHLLG